MRIGSLFSGCGGLELGLEAALPNSSTVWQVEKDNYARGVLSKHWPEARRYDDIRTIDPANLAPVDLICGGFPCQDISAAGKGAGLGGSRSGLWWEMLRVVCGMVERPKIVVVENVPALTIRGLPEILGSLAEAGFDAEWDCISARSQGAPHLRSRIFIISYPSGGGRAEGDSANRDNGSQGLGRDGEPPRVHSILPHPHGAGQQKQRRPEHPQKKNATLKRHRGWAAEPAMGRVAYGVPRRVDRLRLLGNAVVPQVAYRVGLRVGEIINERSS
jgi:DNA (cytosine-5)-methyltransferase 1